MNITDALPLARTTPAPVWLQQAWATGCTEHRVAVNDGAQINCRTRNMDRDDLPAMIMVHGFRAHARWWDHIAPWFAEDYRIVAIDLAGMGDSDTRASYSRRGFARDLLQVVAHFKLAKPLVVAHSFGGVVSWLAAEMAPQAFGRIILIDSIMEIFEGKKPSTLRMIPLRTYPDQDQAMLRFHLIPPGNWPDPHILTYIAEHSVRPCDGGWTWKFDPLTAEFLIADDWGPVGPVSVPTSFIYGDRSAVLPRHRVDRILNNLPNCERVVCIPASDHHILIEQPLALVAALRALIAPLR